LERPLIPVDHLAAHLYAGQMVEPSLEGPCIGLVVSGGHTVLCVMHPQGQYERLGETKDDAVGEAFDKVAKVLGLGYPGGPVIDRLSDQGDARRAAFPRVRTKHPYDFSFSGLKTAVHQYVKRITAAAEDSAQGAPATLNPQQVADIAAGFQEAAVEALVTRTLKACQRTGIRQVIVGGGVASNRRLRARLSEAAEAQRCRVVFPPVALCVDNGAMVAGIGFALLQQGRVGSLSMSIDSNLCLA
jgi:N6-L-threonylcarbamoyladenine synthase